MRVLVVAPNAGHVGGVETYLETLIPALAVRGHEIGVWHERGVSRTRAAESAAARWYLESDGDALASAARWRPDLVFTHGLRSPALESRLVAIAPAITFAHSYIGTCISGHKLHAFPAPVVCSRVFGPACLALYYPRHCGGWNPATAVSLYKRQGSRRRLLEHYRFIVVASQHMAREYARHGLAHKTRVVPLPVAAPRSGPGAAARTVRPWRLLYLGRLEWTKGADLAIDAAAMAASSLGVAVHLVLAGSGSMEHELRRLAERTAAAHPYVTYQFAGAVPPEDRTALLQRTDLLLVPSRWPEPFGLVGNEAGLLGVPSLAFAAGGITDWLIDSVNGRLVHGAPDAARFAQALAQLLADPPALKAMGLAAIDVAGRFTLDAHVQALEAVFREATAPAERPTP